MNRTQKRSKRFFTVGLMFLLCILYLLLIISENVSAAGSITVYSPSSGQTLYQEQTSYTGVDLTTLQSHQVQVMMMPIHGQSHRASPLEVRTIR